MRHPLCALCLTLALLASLPAQGPQVPAGFVDEGVVDAGVDAVTALAFLPDGRLIVTNRASGDLSVIVAGVASVIGTVVNLDPGPPAEQGLLAVEVDPQWPTRPYLYVLYTSLMPQNVHLAMFPVSGDLNSPTSTNLTLGPEYLIIDDIPDAFNFHNGGKCRFGPQGHLFVSLGDDQVPCSAQDLAVLPGKILRLDVSSLPLAGSGPPPKAMIAAAGNPFGGTNGQLIWAYGLRNPYSFHVDPASGDLLIADVGAGSREEIDLCSTAGQNFGWPYFEGTQAYGGGSSCPPASGPLVAPLVEYSHGTGSNAVISMGLYGNPPGVPASFGAEYEGDYFYVDIFDGVLFRLDHDGTGFSLPTPWATGIDSPTDAAVGPDGALYYTRGPWNQGSVRRIRRDIPPASLNSVGNGCAGTSGMPLTLAGSGLPALGNLGFGLTVSSGPPGGSVSLFLATGLAATPVALAGSCVIYLDLGSALALVSAGVSPFVGALDPMGATTYPVPIPSAPGLGGLAVDFQVVGLDPQGPGGFVTSNGLSLVIGL